MPRYVVGVDNGGTFIKAAVFDEEGNRVGLAKTPSVTTTLPGGRVEIDLDALWAANAACVKHLIEETGVDPADISCIGFAGQGKGLYLLGHGGRVIRNAITSADDRARDHVERWEADGTASAVRTKTLQGLFSAHPVAMLAWLKDNEPGKYADIAWVFGMKDYLVYRTTDAVVSDTSSQSGNSFVNLLTSEYDPEILTLLGIPEIDGKLPPMLHATDICGEVTTDAAAQLGCHAGTKVIAGMFDVNASAVAAGLVNSEALCVISGTVGVNVHLAREPVTDGSVALTSLYCIPGYFLIEEGSNTSIGGLEWVLDTLFQDERANAGTDSHSLYATVAALAADVPPEDCHVIFLPYLSGDGGTGRSRGSWLGMSTDDGRAELVRAAYEGWAFAHRRQIDRLLRNRSVPPAVRLAGGGARSPLFVQLIADVLQIPVRVTIEDELGVKGVAMAAGIATGVYADFADAVVRCAPVSATVEPDPAKREIYERKYARFTEALDTLGCIWMPSADLRPSTTRVRSR